MTFTHTCADFSPGSWLPGWVLAPLSLDVHTEKTFCPESRTASPSPKAASRQTENIAGLYYWLSRDSLGSYFWFDIVLNIFTWWDFWTAGRLAHHSDSSTWSCTIKILMAIYVSCFSPLTQNVVAWGEAQLSTERSEPPSGSPLIQTLCHTESKRWHFKPENQTKELEGSEMFTKVEVKGSPHSSKQGYMITKE